MATGKMDWVAMRDAISGEINKGKTEWITKAEEVKKKAIDVLLSGYEGAAAEATATKMDEVITAASQYFEGVMTKIAAGLEEEAQGYEDLDAAGAKSVNS